MVNPFIFSTSISTTHDRHCSAADVACLEVPTYLLVYVPPIVPGVNSAVKECAYIWTTHLEWVLM